MIYGALLHTEWAYKSATATGGRRKRRQGCSPNAYHPRGPPFETPHKGYHYAGQRERFFEGWYWRVTLPGDAESFALIYSVEDPSGDEFSGVGAQVRVLVEQIPQDYSLAGSLVRPIVSLDHLIT